MKKTVSFLIALLLILSCASVSFADDIAKYRLKRHGMSDEDILQMYDLTISEMQRRGLSPIRSGGVAVPPGLYQVGVDIPQGTYRLEFPDDDLDYGFITLFDENKEMTHFLNVGKLHHVQVFGKLELIDGMYFQLTDTTATFYPYTGLFQ